MRAHTVVILGNFNPAIFSPEWVRKYLTLKVDDGQEAEIQIIHSDISDFMLSDIRFTIERNRMMFSSLSHDIELLAALAIETFASVLSHTPVWAYGINLERHIDFQSFEKRNALGRKLCPLDPWGEWAKGMENADPLKNGGMASIQMKKILNVEPDIWQTFTIQPSNAPDLKNNGVFFQVNNHYGDKTMQNKNDEERREVMFRHLRENVAFYVKSYNGVVEHFLAVEGVDG